MRMRMKKWARPELLACPWYADVPEEARGQWAARFPKNQPLQLELGCGKAVSTAQMALRNPDINYLAVDMSTNVLGVARRNFMAAYGDRPVENVILTHFDAMWISRFLSPEDRIGRIYISFCNPWTQRKNQFKRRLTHPRQLLQYREFLTPGGQIWFKTDDETLFRASLRYFALCGFSLVYQTDDLHHSGFSPNYVSEHEEMYAAQGVPIRFCIAQMEDLNELPDLKTVD